MAPDPTNKAAVLVTKAAPLVVQSVEYTAAGQNEVVVKNGAVAVNPYDWIIEEAHNLVVPRIKLPFILGTDVAGEIVEVGEGVTRFKAGDRVVAHATALIKPINRSSQGGFQEYTVLRQDMTSSIPASISYEAACVLPLGLSTAACALFQNDYLALPFPTTSTSPAPSGTTLLVWGGATSVGCNAIQLAKAAGCEVITTASPKNNAYLEHLGAAAVFDYRSPTVIRDLTAAFQNRQAAGAISIGAGSLKACIEVLGACQGNKFVAQCTLDLPAFPKSVLGFPPFVFGVASEIVSGTIRSRMKGVGTKFVNGGDLVGKEVGKAIYEDFLPEALGAGTFVPAPDPFVVGKGLERVQEAMDISKKGVSAKKVVVTL
ncbi:Dehydrogenase azaJ [Lachnellula arida]|uniref:Dehydrogenase azaJ n=1 Tax=Lachnellula arida TaxID=1316785 RepID=A0A8T9B6I5_9HELO|nr:Dehydrogenase azaJ [Lachnellula arida]